jgi:predicted dehydrogenase
VKIGLIGSTGHVSIATGGLRELQGIEVAGMAPGSAGESMEKAAQLLDKAGFSAPRYDDGLRLIQEAKPDLVVIACHFGDHARYAEEALRRGMHVFVEKPVATTLADLEKVRLAYDTAGTRLAAMFGSRTTPAFRTAYQAVRQGKIGRIRLVQAQKSYRLGIRKAPYLSRDTYGGTIPWVGSHAIDWVLWFTGERFRSVYATHSREENRGHGDLEMSAQCQFVMTGGIAASVSVDYLRPESAPTHGDDRIRIAGTEGVLEIRDQEVLLINGEASGIQKLKLLESRNLFAEFVHSIEGRGECTVSAEESFLCTEACLKARQSADESRVVLF